MVTCDVCGAEFEEQATDTGELIVFTEDASDGAVLCVTCTEKVLTTLDIDLDEDDEEEPEEEEGVA